MLTDLHGQVKDEDTDEFSDLPLLMAMYEPGMVMESVNALLEDNPDSDMVGALAGLQLNLMNH